MTPTLGLPARRTLNALTIDVEDYYHVSGFEGCVSRAHWDSFESRVVASTRRLLNRLDEAGVTATFFVLGWVAKRNPRLVRAIHAAGHEIGCHSYWHHLIYEQTPDEFRSDLRRGLDVLEDALGMPVRAYRAPSFSITRDSLWALDILAEEGIQLDSSIYPTHHDRYGIAGTPLGPHRIERSAGTLWEFPPPVWRILGYPLPVGGGGYFRLYPYTYDDAARCTGDQRGGPAVRLLPASVGTRPRSAAAQRPVGARSFRHLRQPAPNRGAAGAVAARLRFRPAERGAGRQISRNTDGSPRLTARFRLDSTHGDATGNDDDQWPLGVGGGGGGAIDRLSRPPRSSTSRPLHVVIVDEELPYPPTSGKRLRTLNLTMRLAARHRITYICHRNSDPDEARAAAAY